MHADKKSWEGCHKGEWYQMAKSDDDKHLAVLLPIIICVMASVGGSVAYNFEVNESNPNINFDLNSKVLLAYNDSIKGMNLSLNKNLTSKNQRFLGSIINLRKSGNKNVSKGFFSSQIGEFNDNHSLEDINSKPMEVNASSGIKWDMAGTKTVYLTSDRIMSKKTDREFLERIKSNLQESGIRVIIDPRASHPDQVPRAIENAPEGSAVVIVNYNCAGTIKDLGEGISGPQTNGNPNKGYLYGFAKDLTGIIYVNISPNTFLTNNAYLPRAYDDDFSPRSFEGLNNPAEYLLDNGISLIDSPRPDDPVMGIERADIISSQILELLKL